MKPLTSPLRRGLIRTVYLLPAITGLILLVYAMIPHLFFMRGELIYNTQSPFALMSTTWTECQALFDAVEASAGAVSFSFLMSAVVILSWIFSVLYTVVAIASAICSCVAFSHRPTAKESNRAKRWMQFFCANRVLYVISLLLPLLPAAFPYILVSCYQKQLFFDVSLYFMGPPDLLLAIVFAVLNAASFLFLLPAQSEEHMDMFRLYKSK